MKHKRLEQKKAALKLIKKSKLYIAFVYASGAVSCFFWFVGILALLFLYPQITIKTIVFWTAIPGCASFQIWRGCYNLMEKKIANISKACMNYYSPKQSEEHFCFITCRNGTKLFDIAHKIEMNYSTWFCRLAIIFVCLPVIYLIILLVLKYTSTI